ncbi:ABC transporter permease [Frigidibacter sp. ROC022]|uniref:ABC transporter permease n=1 Tax=Frigidibacter sp. ROC022 TaxID=2971796 RepID=UPI00215B2E40|nr:FtsX-like permease family protein [Frigidibacter sp. ROC022]MCR8724206.1 drug:proton antiporter [Frigidibacter sp. ROC022]
MSLRLAARLARRELRGGLSGFRVFIACLALGVAAIAAVGTVRGAIDEGLSREGATLLGGSAEIELTYRYATEAERAWMESQGQVSEVVDFRSMAVAGEGDSSVRGLTQVKGVDAAYPLLGAVELSPAMPLAQALDGQDGLPGAVMDPVLIARMGLEPGAVFRLGTQDFVLMAALTHEPDSAGGFTLGPRTLVRTEDLANSGLLAPGTLFETDYRLLLPPETALETVKQAAETQIEGGGYRWRDARNGEPGLQRFVDRLSAFLILTGLAGLAVGGVGISAAVRSYLTGKRATIATFKVLGATRRVIFLTYALQITVLAGLGIGLGLLLGGVLPVLALPLVEARLAVPAGSPFQPAALAEAALYGALAAALFTLWPLAATERIRAATLYRDAALGRGQMPRPAYVLATLALLGALIGAAAGLTGAAALTLWAAGALLAAFGALLAAALLVRALARLAKRSRALRGWTTLRLALGAVGGPGGEAVSVVLSLGLGLTVLAAVGQIDANLRGAIARDLPQVAPSFFVVDLQGDQLDSFKARLAADPQVEKVETAPMLRGVITRINGRPARDVTDHWVVRGDRGVTYSAEKPANTTLTAGEWWPEDYSGPPLVSFAAEEAAEIGLKLGDSLTVNILGRDIDATIASFREVDFSNAGIGFVLSMNPAALQGAPHSHIATIYADPEADGRLLRDLSDAYPNITLIGVRDAIARVTDILGAIAAAVTVGALATLATGAIVLIGAAAAGERARVFEAAVLKTLGASRRAILTNFALRSVILGAAAGLVAIAAGGLSGWAVCHFLMETDYRFEPWSALAIVSGGVLVTLLSGLAFALRPLATPPARVLRAQD